MNNIELISYLPDIPETFQLTSDEIRNLECLTPQTLQYGYGSFRPNNEITEFLQSYFDSEIIVRYQLIWKDLPAHQDICDQDFKYNYIYELGGSPVITSWWDQEKLQEQIHCKDNMWYKLNVRNFHSVSGIQQERCSITIKINDLQA
jgi:hypothetical protein